MTTPKMTLVDWLDDLCVRFIVNLPNEELQSVERICFQIEEAQWFYEDFIRPLDPNNLPSMHLRKFSQLMFQHCPLFSAYSEELHQQAYEQFLAYKTRVPVRGAIMLNEDMTHAVLVKGWKKGAKWSFPRGKINKEEADLDCAVREVYEETGFDLREANLVEPDEQMKKITVTMREQSMMLYVFRGVPMDAYFEPRTRKEISKIDWYKLTDLPTLRRKNQVQQQGTGNDLIKESSFYMVAPFLGPLRSWIKQQHKLDRQRVRNSAHLAPPPAITDDEDLQPDIYETTADEAPSGVGTQPSDSFANLVAQLGRNHRPSDTLPEVSIQAHLQQQPVDPAAELKRILSVGMDMASPPVEAPGVPTPSQPQANPLLALFRQGNDQPQGPRMPLPQTPFEQVMSPPTQPQSPHGQHHPRPPQNYNMPPPPFPFPPHPQDLPIRGPPQFYNGMPAQMSPQFMSPQPQAPNMQQAFDQRNHQAPMQQTIGSQFTGGQGRPAIPPASNLPAPKLTAHTLGLLNSFRVNEQKPAPAPSSTNTVQPQAQRSSQITPRIQHPLPQHRPHDLASPQGPYAPSPPQYQSPPVSLNFQPEQPKPRTTHQDSLLTLFRATPPVTSPEPAELSAHPTTPGYVFAQPVANSSKVPNPALLESFGNLTTKMDMTSATVSGPVNAPDFDTMKKNSQHHLSGSSRGPSPATQMPFMPQQILKREQPNRAPQSPAELPQVVRNGTSKTAAKTSNLEQPAFKPQILKRPQQQQQQQQQQQNITLAPVPKPTAHAQGLLDMFKSPSPQPAPVQAAQPALLTRSPAPIVAPNASSGRETVPNEQKSALLALFSSKASPSPQPSRSPAPPTRSPFPPTPKTSMSGIISPVSPLPANGSQTGSPADLASRSRISSIGDGMPPKIDLAIPPTSHPTSAPQAVGDVHGLGNVARLGGQAKGRDEGKSPVDKTFLLGFLEDVARRGR
ncbi:Nn.00g104210.m01.CDS01 [Neocucurbitaria sp. VM-36]